MAIFVATLINSKKITVIAALDAKRILFNIANARSSVRFKRLNVYRRNVSVHQ